MLSYAKINSISRFDNTTQLRASTSTPIHNILRARPQPKLKIGAVNDPAEVEADRVADQVMRMPDKVASTAVKPANLVGSILRRKCTDCEDETIQRKETPEIRMKGDAGASGGGAPSPEASRAINSLGAGAPLPASERRFFEPRFGRDLSNIRLYTGGTADAASKAINARAFSLGNSIAFASGEYSPGTHSGRTLMAHEITHALQGGKSIRRYRKKTAYNFGVNDEGNLVEQEFRDPKTQPWISNVSIRFDKNVRDRNGNSVQSGRLKVTYHDKNLGFSNFSLPVSGGSPTVGLSDLGNFTVHRLEGYGYTSGAFTDPNEKLTGHDSYGRKRYVENNAGNMDYAVFYNKGEALHLGYFNQSSHGCIHVEHEIIRQINYHSVAGKTKVTVEG